MSESTVIARRDLLWLMQHYRSRHMDFCADSIQVQLNAFDSCKPGWRMVESVLLFSYDTGARPLILEIVDGKLFITSADIYGTGAFKL